MYRVTFGCRAWRNSVFPLLFDRATVLIFRRFPPSPSLCSRGFALIFFSFFEKKKKNRCPLNETPAFHTSAREIESGEISRKEK